MGKTVAPSNVEGCDPVKPQWKKFFERDCDTGLHIWNDTRSPYVQIARVDTR